MKSKCITKKSSIPIKCKNISCKNKKNKDKNTLWVRYEKFTNHFEINLLVESLTNLLAREK